MILRPPRSTRTDTLFPYTTLFRSDAVPAEHLTVPAGLDFSNFDFAAAGSPHRWADYEAGERIDHGDAMTIEEAEHQMATRLYQNTARVHFNQQDRKSTRLNSSH